jgi:hypothetical protein
MRQVGCWSPKHLRGCELVLKAIPEDIGSSSGSSATSSTYLASPVDVLPEVMLGPFGLLDDAGAVTAAAVFVYKLVTVKGRLEDAGVKGRGRPDLLE